MRRFRFFSNIVLLLASLLSFSQPTLSQSGWSPVNSETFININKIQFVNPYTGWDCGEQLDTVTRYTLNKSTDGGITWVSQINNMAYGNRLISLFFNDPNTGWIGGADGLQKTTNGGNTYVGQVFAMLVFNDIYFINSSTGWACGLLNNAYGIIKTTDAGNGWIIQYNTAADSSSKIPYSIHFINSSIGWTVCSSFILFTSNSGSNWIRQNIGNFSGLNSVFPASINKVLIVGNAGTILYSSNSGTNWLQQNSPTTNNLHSVYFNNPDTGYIVGGNSILKTTNSGVNWFIQQTISGANLNCVTFIDANSGFVSGQHGLIYKTSNGGGPIGIKPINSEIPVLFNLYQNYPNPFNPSTTIKFDLPSEINDYPVSLKIYNILGEEVTSLVNEKLKPGTYSVEWNATNFSSGVYFYQLDAGYYKETNRMVLIK